MTNHLTSFAGLAALFAAANIASAQINTASSASSAGGQTAVQVNPATGLPAAQNKFAQAEEQLEAAQTALTKAGVAPRPNAWVLAGGGAGSSSRSLIIPKDGADGKALEECEEDLNVMARILDKAIDHRSGKNRNAMGITVHGGLFGDSAAPRNLYIDGYGALFFLDVNYPLVAPPAKKPETESKEDTSSEWEETRRELYRDPWGQPYAIIPPPMTFGGGPAEEYDTERVDDLKKDLIAALKNAAHIRRLKSDETVTLVVSGRNRGLEPKVLTRKSSGGGGGSYSSSSTVKIERYGQRGGESRGSQMILRARKSDIEALQKEKLTAEEFQKKVSVQVY